MSHKYTALAVFLLVAVCIGLFQVKYRVEGMRERADALALLYEEDAAAIRVLKTEWAYLTRPQRLQELAERFLPLQPVEARQLSALEALSLRPLADVTPPGDVNPPKPRKRPLQVSRADTQDRAQGRAQDEVARP